MDKFIKIEYFKQASASEFSKLKRNILEDTTASPWTLYINPEHVTSIVNRSNTNSSGEVVYYRTITLASGEMFFTLMTLDEISQAINNLTN